MGKLLRSKECLTVEDAAKHLSTVFREEVSKADVLRLALDRQLKLSINFCESRACAAKQSCSLP